MSTWSNTTIANRRGGLRPDGVGDGLTTAARSELAQDRRHVVLDGALGEKEPVGDLRVPGAFTDELQDLELACGERGGVSARRRPRASGNIAGAEDAQAAGDDGRGGPAAQL